MRSEIDDNDIYKIRELAIRFRLAIEKAREENRFWKDQRFRCFPTGCCGITSELLAKYLYDNGIRNKIMYISATYYDISLENPPHAWLVVNKNVVIDITGDQFKYYPEPLKFKEPVYVGFYNDFYSSFSLLYEEVCNNCELDDIQYNHYLSRKELYDIIYEYI